MNKLEWAFSLLDGVSGPAERMSGAVNGMTDKLADLSHMSTVLEGMASGMGMVVSAAEQVVAVMERVGAATYGAARTFGEFVIGVARERESSLVALRTVLGDQAQAQAVFADSLQIAQVTPFATADVIRDRMQLVLGGFTAAESRVLYAAAADVGAALGPDRQATLQNAFRRIGASGKLEGRVLEELDAAGVGRANIFRTMAMQMGRTTLLNNQRALAAWAEPMLAHLTSDRALSVVVETINRRISGGHGVGSFAVAQSQTMTGLLSNLQSLPHDLFAGIDLENQPGILGFKRTLQDIMELLGPTTELGQRATRSFMGLANALLGGLFGTGASHMDDLEEPLTRILDVVDNLSNVVARIVPMIRAFFSGFVTTGLEEASDFLGIITGHLTDANPLLSDATDHMETMGSQVASAIASFMRFAEGIASDWLPRIRDAISSITSSTDPFVTIGTTIGGAIFQGIVDALEGRLGDFLSSFLDPSRIAAHMTGNDRVGHGAGADIFSEWQRLSADASQEGRVGAAMQRLTMSTEEQFDGSGAVSGMAFAHGFRRATRTHSPSEVFERIGEDLQAGLAIGMGPAMAMLNGGSQIRMHVTHEHDMRLHVSGDSAQAHASAAAIAENLAPHVRDILRRVDLGMVTD